MSTAKRKYVLGSATGYVDDIGDEIREGGYVVSTETIEGVVFWCEELEQYMVRQDDGGVFSLSMLGFKKSE